MKKVKALGVGCGLFIVMVMFCMLYLWTATKTKISYAESESSPSESVYAVNMSQTYVQFDEQGISPMFVEYGATNVQFPVPESDGGKEFQGWYYNGIMYADAEGQQVVAWDIQAEEVTLSAKWSVEKYAYDKYGKVSGVTQSGAAERTYTYAYKETAAHELASITTGMYKFSPQTDKLGRNAGREVWNNEAKLAAEYIYYRKVGDHATNMPSAVYFGKKSGENFPITENIKYAYDRMGNISRIDENGAPMVWYKYDALNRLIREDNKTFGKTWLYSYDNNGNILCKRTTDFTLKENVEESEFESVQYEYEGDKLLAYGTEACTYDAIGNPTT